MQEIDDDHLLGVLDEDDEMLAAAREAQILGQIRIDDPTAVLRHGRTGRDLRAADDQVILIGRRLSRAEGLKGPVRDVDK